MRTLILSVLVVLAAGCATQRQQEPIKLPPTIPLPPMPAPEAVMKRQSIRAFSAASSVSVSSSSDPTSPNYGTIARLPFDRENGSKGVGVRIAWNNWGTNSYAIQKSTNLVNWTDVVMSKKGGPSEVLIYDLNDHEFYRIIRVFSSP